MDALERDYVDGYGREEEIILRLITKFNNNSVTL